MNLFFDLDGTLVDSRDRLYQLFCDLSGQNELTYEQYWILKRSMHDHEYILVNYLGYDKLRVEKFNADWLTLIETPRYLSMDRPFPFTKFVLQELAERGHFLYLMTARQSKEQVFKQLNEYGLREYFLDVFVTETIKTKARLIQGAGLKLFAGDVCIGDTGEDVRTAKLLGVKSLAILSGFRDQATLLTYGPDYIEDDIQSIFKYV